MISKEKGSLIAKNGFKNEKDIVVRFNNWRIDELAQNCLCTMGYNLNEIKSVTAIKNKRNYKADIVVKIEMLEGNKIYEEPISVKLVSNKSGFNQIDKRWVDNYKELFNIPDEISVALKLYCGEIKHNNPTARDSRRLFLDEIKSGLVDEIITFFDKYKKDIISTFFKGNGEGAAKWILVVHKDSDNQKFILKDIKDVIDFYANGDTYITKNGNMKVGQVSMQRKGGDGGRKTANMLQFKFNPLLIFEI